MSIVHFEKGTLWKVVPCLLNYNRNPVKVRALKREVGGKKLQKERKRGGKSAPKSVICVALAPGASMTLTPRAWSTHRGQRVSRLLWRFSAWFGCCASALRCVVAQNVGTKRCSLSNNNSISSRCSCSSNSSSSTIIITINITSSNVPCHRLPACCRRCPTTVSALLPTPSSRWTLLERLVRPEVTVKCTDTFRRKKVECLLCLFIDYFCRADLWVDALHNVCSIDIEKSLNFVRYSFI